MALTDTQKAQVIYFLGWPGKTLMENSTNFSKVVSDRLDNLSTDIENQVATLLAKLKKVDDKLEEAMCRFAATKVGNVETNENERSLLKGERKRYQCLLSDLLDIPVQSCGCSNGIRMIV